MDPLTRIRRQFEDNAQLAQDSAAQLAEPIAQAIDLLVAVLANDRKILVCGNGGSAADAQHFAAELVGRFERERPELAALALNVDTSALTAIGNDYGFDQVFAKQVRGLGQAGDALMAISTGGGSANVLAAIDAAHERGLSVIGLSGKGGGRFNEVLGPGDVHICVPHERTARIQEIHILAIHCICDGIDAALLGEG